MQFYHVAFMHLSRDRKEFTDDEFFDYIRGKGIVSILFRALETPLEEGFAKYQTMCGEHVLKSFPMYIAADINYNGENDYANLVHDLNETNPSNMVLSIIRDRMDYLKNTEEGRSELLRIKDLHEDLGTPLL